MSTYNVTWTSGGTQGLIGKSTIAVLDGTTDTSTSLTLTGKGVNSYGEIQQTNFIRLLENFASTNAPTNPTIGQLWFNPTDAAIYVCMDIAHSQGQTLHYQNGQLGWVNIGNLGSTGTGTVTAASIAAALGYTPYSAANPNGYLSSITSSLIVNALGYTPYNGTTNPNGYITAASLPSSSVLSVAGRGGNVTLSQADITGLTSTSTPAFSNVSIHGGTASAVNPSAPANGDIQVNGSVISIYANGAWQQVFPAVYS